MMPKHLDSETRFIVQIHYHPSDRSTALPPPVVAHHIVGRVLPQITASGTDSRGLFSAVPAFDTVADARAETGANVSIVLASPQFTADAILEAADAGIELVVAYGAALPAEDYDRVAERMTDGHTILVGPGDAALFVPDVCHIGAIPSHLCAKGEVAILADSSVAAAQTTLQTTALGLGQSMIFAVGDGPGHRVSTAAALRRALKDPATASIALVLDDVRIDDGLLSVLASCDRRKPVVAYIGDGMSDYHGQFGGNGNVVSFANASLPRKAELLRGLGVTIIDRPAALGSALKRAFDLRQVRDGSSCAGLSMDFASVMRRVEQDIYQAV
jgi:succinyl-CoA synthetase alpha subunit